MIPHMLSQIYVRLNKCQPRFMCSVWTKIMSLLLIQIECILYIYVYTVYYTQLCLCVCIYSYQPQSGRKSSAREMTTNILRICLSGKKGTKLRCCNQVLFDSVQCKQLQTIANSKLLANLFLDRETGALQIEKRHLIELNNNICHCHKLDQRPLLLAEPICILL